MACNRHSFGQSGEEPSIFAAVVKVGNIHPPPFCGGGSPTDPIVASRSRF